MKNSIDRYTIDDFIKDNELNKVHNPVFKIIFLILIFLTYLASIIGVYYNSLVYLSVIIFVLTLISAIIYDTYVKEIDINDNLRINYLRQYKDYVKDMEYEKRILNELEIAKIGIKKNGNNSL